MEFVKSVSEKRELRNGLVLFYLEEKKKENKIFCEYDLERVYLFINMKRNTLLFDIFDILVDYLVSIVRVKFKKKCFGHLYRYNCFHYFPLSHTSEKTLSLVEFFKKYNFNLTEVFRILSIIVCKTRYGDSYIIKFCCGSISYKTWLSKSAFNTIYQEVRQNPLFYDYYTREVYFKVDHFDEYLGRKYAKLVVEMEPRYKIK